MQHVWISLAMALAPAAASAAQLTWKVGGSDGLPWSQIASLQVEADVNVIPGAIQPWELRPDVNVLPRINEAFNGYWDRWQFPFNPFWEDGTPRLWRGPGNFQYVSEFQPTTTYVDGDRETILWGITFNKMASEYYTIDMGAAVPVERFELHLPPEFLEDGWPNPSCCDRFGTPWSHYVPHQGELSGVKEETTRLINESLGLDHNPIGDDHHYKPLKVFLASVEQHLVAPIIIDFPLQYFRFVRWRTWPDEYWQPPYGPRCCYGIMHNLGYGEMELYGRGFAGEMRYKTAIQDLRQPATLGRIFVGVSKWRREGAGWVGATDGEGNLQRRWEVGELVEAPDAYVEVTWRLKNGTTEDPGKYLAYNDQGELIELEHSDWDGLRTRTRRNDPKFVGWKGPVIENREDWSAWTGPMNQTGARLDMASRRYFQLEVKAVSEDFWEMARIDSIAIEYFPLLVPTLVGEVGLPDDVESLIAEVAIGEPTEFIFALSAEFNNQRRDGFDVLRIDTPSEPEFLRLLQGKDLREVELDLATDVQTDSLGMTIRLPDMVQTDEKFQVAFMTSVFTVATQLCGTVFNSDNSEIQQRVEEGDATDMIATNKVGVIASGDAVKDVIDQLAVKPRVFTPNDDGRNDDLRFAYTLFGITNADVEIAIYTLAGEPVHTIKIADVAGGEYARTWNGRTATGELVDPGVYLAQVTAKTGRGSFEITRPFSVAY